MTVTKRDQVIEQIRELITNGQIGRGDRIMQDELAARFGTSITPVREALLQLEVEGVLVGHPHRGLRVAEANVEKLQANYVMRRLAECHAMRRATLRCSRLDIQKARALNQAMITADKERHPEKIGQLNRQFHFLFYDRNGLPELSREIEGLWLSFPWDILQVLPKRRPPSFHEHEAMVSAVESGDLDAVEQATIDHLWNSIQALLERLTGTTPADPFDITVG